MKARGPASLIFFFLTLFICARGVLSHAEEQAMTVFDVYVGELKADGLKETLILSTDDLKGSIIEISGKSSSGVRRVLISLDNGRTWVTTVGAGELGAGYWSHKFIPSPGKEYAVLLKPYDIWGNAAPPTAFTLFYDGRPNKAIIEDRVEELEAYYNDKNLEGFFSLFDAQSFTRLAELREKFSETFTNSGNLDLSLRIRRVEIVKDTATVTVNWTRLWENESSAEGWGDGLRFHRKPNWIIVNITSEKVFIRGLGTVKVRLMVM